MVQSQASVPPAPEWSSKIALFLSYLFDNLVSNSNSLIFCSNELISFITSFTSISSSNNSKIVFNSFFKDITNFIWLLIKSISFNTLVASSLFSQKDGSSVWFCNLLTFDFWLSKSK